VLNSVYTLRLKGANATLEFHSSPSPVKYYYQQNVFIFIKIKTRHIVEYCTHIIIEDEEDLPQELIKKACDLRAKNQIVILGLDRFF